MPFVPLAEHQYHEHCLIDRERGSAVETTAFALRNKPDILQYVQDSMKYAVQEVAQRDDDVSFFFNLAELLKFDSLIFLCLELYTTYRLIRRRFYLHGNETLDMPKLGNSLRSLPPRMVRNHITHILELRLWTLDQRIRKTVQSLLYARRRVDWVRGTLAVFFLIHVQELDAGRLISWSRNGDPVCWYCTLSQGSFGLIRFRMASGSIPLNRAS